MSSDPCLKEKYYYIRAFRRETSSYHRFGIVVLLSDEKGNIARGVSICSEEDNFTRDDGFIRDPETGGFKPFMGGLKLARKRAVKALMARRPSEFIRRGKVMSKVWAAFSGKIAAKSDFMPELTPFEQELLWGKKSSRVETST